MSERYKPGRLKREWSARIAAGAMPRDPRLDAIARAAQDAQERRVTRLEGSRRIVHCNHGVSWLDCRVCSKPRSGR